MHRTDGAIVAHGFLFDMDGTLVNSDIAVRTVLQRWCEKTETSYQEVEKISHGRRAEDTVQSIRPDLNVKEEAAWIYEQELCTPDGILPIGGAVEFLSKIESDDWGIVTSAPRALAEYRLGLAGIPVPKIFITGDMVSQGKPDPEGFIQGRVRLSLEPEDIVSFEDSEAGLCAALEAKNKVIAIGEAASAVTVRGDFQIVNYTELSIERSSFYTINISE